MEKQELLHILSVSLQTACALLSFLAFPALQYFSTLSLKRHDFRQKCY